MRLTISILATVAVPLAVAAQNPAPLHALGSVVAESRQNFGVINAVRALPDGRVLVNDSQNHQVLLLDANLAVVAVVADSGIGSTWHGRGPGTLIPFTADSTLYSDVVALAFLVIDPGGKVARVMAAPQPGELVLLPLVQVPATDKQGRLIYRGTNAAPPSKPTANGMYLPSPPLDSSPLKRLDFTTRKLDTIARLKVPASKVSFAPSEDGRSFSVIAEVNPIPLVDEWALMTDGSIALLRGQDFHVDWIDTDGARSRSPRIPFEWQRISDDDKAAIIDSVKRVLDARAQEAAPASRSASSSELPTSNAAPALRSIPPSELPDYRPAFQRPATIASNDNTLWVATTATIPGMTGNRVYYVIDRAGRLVERVLVPTNRRVSGFGSDGSVYLVWRDGTGAHISRVRRSAP